MKIENDLGIDIIQLEPPPRPKEPPITEEDIHAGKYDDIILYLGMPWRRGDKARLARVAGVSRQYITELTSGRRKASPQTAEKLCRAAQTLNIWGITPSDFTGNPGQLNVKFGPPSKRSDAFLRLEMFTRQRSFLPTSAEVRRIYAELETEYRMAVESPKSCLNRYARRLRRLIRQERRRLAECALPEKKTET